MARHLETVEWASTPLGPVETWPQSLVTALRIVLTSRFSMWMCWGPELTFFCNDAYRRDTLGRKYPWALGRPTAEVWSEIWDDIGPRISAVLDRGQATWDESLMLFLERAGYQEETYHTFSYSPLADDGGRVAGLFCVVSEDTDRVVAERRMATLRDLATATAPATDEDEVMAIAARELGANARDAPFVLLYRLDDDAAGRLSASSGFRGREGMLPAEVRAGDPAWSRVVESVVRGAPVVVDDADRRWPGLPSGPWAQPPAQVAVIALPRPAQDRPAGFMVVGLNRHRPWDTSYEGFLSLAAGQIAARIDSVRAFEEERRRADALAELDRAKTAFFANVSHEFRTPLTLLLGPAEDALLDQVDPLSAGQRNRVELVMRNGQRLLRLVNSLLDFSRLAAGTAVPHPEPVDLPALTAELARSFAPALERAGLDLSIACPPMDGPVEVDPEMWATIVLNLLSNALKFTFEGGVTVRLRAALGRIELTVADTGIGIPDEEQGRLFERFHRVLGARSRTYEGSGIGLALVAELAALHDGGVQVASEVDRGSSFVVQVPERRPAPEAASAASTGAVAIGAGSAVEPTERTPIERRAAGFVAEALRWVGGVNKGVTGDAGAGTDAGGGAHDAPVHRPRVLVVDDSADMRDYLAGLLGDLYAVETAVDGEDALRRLLGRPPDLVLSDVMMPNLDGFGLLTALRSQPATVQVPVILMSARAGEEGMLEGLEAGADDYLIKPFAARELLARVRANLELDRSRRVRHELERRQVMLDQAERLARVGSFEIDLSTDSVVAASDEMLRMLGADTDPEEGTALTWNEAVERFVHPTDRANAREAIERAVAGGALDLEVRLADAGAGPSRLVRVLGERASGPDDRSLLRCSAQDISDQRQAEQALAAAFAAREMAAREHRIAEELQASLLPALDFTPDSLTVASYYRAGVAGTQVGGDWYDVIELGAGRTALVVGDVMGRGVRAAAVMGQLRAATRAYARLELPPAEVLALLDAAVRDLGEDQIVTCVYAVYDPFDGTISYANAGHVPPLLHGAEGVRSLDSVSAPLGTGPLALSEEVVAAPPGTVITLYTDGLVERRSAGLDTGIESLARALVDALANGRDLDGLAAHLVEQLLPGGPADDVAVLVAGTAPAGGVGTTAVLPLEPDRRAVSRARRWVATTLEAWGIGASLSEDIVLAVDELVTNAVVHAGTPEDLRLRRVGSHLFAEVADGTPVLPRTMRAGSDDEHGRGLQMVGLLAERWGARPTAVGKSVWCSFALDRA